MLIKNSVFFSTIIYAGLSGAASDGKILPFTGEQTVHYRNDDAFFERLRNNDASYVIDHLDEQMHHRYGGKITWFHVAVAMEHFYGHNPREIIDAFAQKVKTSGLCIRQHGSEHYSNDIETILKANVNHPDFYYLCTGRRREGYTPLKLMLTPCELAIRYKSIKTLCAIDAHTQLIPRATMRSFFAQPEYQKDFDLAERAVARSRWRREHSRSMGIQDNVAIAVIENFGSAGVRLLHNYGVDLFFVDRAFPEQPTLFAQFESLHPNQVAEVADLKPVPSKSLFTWMKEWWSPAEPEDQSSESGSEENNEHTGGDEHATASDNDIEKALPDEP